MRAASVRIVVLCFLPLMAVGCATLAPTRPTNPEPFYGTWAGRWQSQVNPASSGDLEVEIIPDAANRPNRVSFYAKLTNAIVPWFSAGGVFRDGGIAFESAGGSTLEFVVYGQDRVEATYYNPNNRDRGKWSLTRKPR
jgi:hypothetical protein